MCGSAAEELERFGDRVKKEFKRSERAVEAVATGGLSELGGLRDVGDKYLRQPVREMRESESNAEKVQVAEADAAAKAKRKEFARVMQAAMLAKRKRSAVSTGNNTMLGGGSSYSGKSLLGS